MTSADRGWKRRRLRHCVTVDPAVPAEVRNDPERTVTFLPMEAVGEQGELDLTRETSVGSASSGYTFVTDGDVLVAKVTPCFENGKGAVAAGLQNGLAFATTEVYALRPNEQLDAQFLDYLMRSSAFRQYGTARLTGAGGLKRISATDLRNYSFMLPAVDEQRAIADFLDRETARIDTLIEEQQRLIELLRERRSATLYCAFNSGSASRLRYTIDFAQTGPFGTQLAATEYVYNTIPVVNPSHIVRGSITPDPAVSVTEKKAIELSRHRFKLGDIVLGRKGEVDKSALVEEREVGYVCGSDSMLLRPCSSAEPKYLWWFLQSPECHSQLRQWSVGSTVTGLNLGTISKIGLPLPSLAEQRRISNYLEDQTSKIDTLIAEAEKFIELARERRAALITAAVTGQIDVRDEVA